MKSTSTLVLVALTSSLALVEGAPIGLTASPDSPIAHLEARVEIRKQCILTSRNFAAVLVFSGIVKQLVFTVRRQE
jgi:hypothetical protein